MKKIIHLLFFITSIYSCKKDASKNDIRFAGIPTIPLPSTDQSIDSILKSEIVDATTFIKLETSPECLIDRIHKVLLYDNRIFILDPTNSGGLFEFDMNGKFKRKYGAKGKGPGEYIFPLSFCINNLNKEVVIYDRALSSLLHYDFDGNFLKNTKVNIVAKNMEITENGKNFIFDTYSQKQRNQKNQSTSYALSITDSRGNIIEQFFETDQDRHNLKFQSVHNLIKNDSITLYNEPFNNIIYKVRDNDVVKLVKFDSGSNGIPDKLFKNKSYTELITELERLEHSYLNTLPGYYFINDKLFFTISSGVLSNNYLYDLQMKKLHRIAAIDNEPNLALSGIKLGVYKNSIISYIPSDHLVNSNYYKKEKFIGTRINEIISNTLETDNPLLIISELNN